MCFGDSQWATQFRGKRSRKFLTQVFNLFDLAEICKLETKAKKNAHMSGRFAPGHTIVNKNVVKKLEAKFSIAPI